MIKTFFILSLEIGKNFLFQKTAKEEAEKKIKLCLFNPSRKNFTF